MCALGWVKCREHISLLVILCIIVYVTNKKIFFYYGFYEFNFFPWYAFLVKLSKVVHFSAPESVSTVGFSKNFMWCEVLSFQNVNLRNKIMAFLHGFYKKKKFIDVFLQTWDACYANAVIK